MKTNQQNQSWLPAFKHKHLYKLYKL